MRKLLDVLRLAWQPKEGILGFYGYVPSRGARYQANLKWVKPEKKKFYHPSRTGDLKGMPVPNPDHFYLPFKHSKELETAEDKVKKIFSLGYQKPKFLREAYENELTEKVRNHAYDSNSIECQIARLTAKIRFYQPVVTERPSKFGALRRLVRRLIIGRRYLLGLLRKKDYKKFEWLLNELDLEYRTKVNKEDSFLTRKKSLELLAKLKVNQIKEEKLATLKKEFDDQKIPFLEKKIIKLKEIKKIEESNNMQVTVTDQDIEECIKKLEEVKIEVAERAKRGYKRKVHPYFLEPYDEKLLWEKEKASESIRE